MKGIVVLSGMLFASLVCQLIPLRHRALPIWRIIGLDNVNQMGN
jgi:hypothetical protein